jgi:hypothetical protein
MGDLEFWIPAFAGMTTEFVRMRIFCVLRVAGWGEVVSSFWVVVYII